MDYKKAYEAAFERAKGIYKEYPSNSTAKVACEQIFPELIESEDERIREALIKGLNFLTTSKRIFTFGDIPIEDIVTYLEKQKEQKPAEWSEKEKGILLECISALQNSGHWLLADKLSSLRPTWKPSERRQPSKPQLAEGVYYIKDSQPVAEYEDGVEIDRLLVIGRYCRFYLSMKDLGIANYKEAQNKAASLGEGWRCPDSFEGRTIGKMPKEIREKAAKIGAEHFKEKGWFWTNEVSDRWDACNVGFNRGSVNNDGMGNVNYVLALSAFQN